MSSFLDYELFKDRDLNLAHVWIQGSCSNKLKVILNQNIYMRLMWSLKCGPVWILPLEQGSDLPTYLSICHQSSAVSLHPLVCPSLHYLFFHPNIFCLFFFFFILLVLLTRPQVLVPGGASDKESASQGRKLKSFGFNPWVWKFAWRRVWQSTLVFLPEESHRQRSLAGYSPYGCKRVGLDWTELIF